MYKTNKSLEVVEGVYKTGIDGLLYIKPNVFVDDRGFFAQLGNLADLNKVIEKEFLPVQMNQSRSETGVARGFHAEDWNKLAFLASGKAFCALADFRPHSPTFAKVEKFVLDSIENNHGGALYIPKGIANSFLVLKGPVNYIYLFDKLYKDRNPKGDVAISLFDKDIGVDWPIEKEKMMISERDRSAVTLREKFPDKF